MNYYNENNKHAAAWLRVLIEEKLIPEGKVDERSIAEVGAGDLAGFCQCHFFAGIGGWPYALSLAGWSQGKEVWTGSCPCQPFSCAGKAQGLCDERHLWPAFRGLIQKCNPSVVFGEQVASKDGRAWLAGVRSDLEGDGYAVGAADLCAAGVGAPHIRQRLYWVADAEHAKRRAELEINRESHGRNGFGRGGDAVRLANAASDGRSGRVRQQPGIASKEKAKRGMLQPERNCNVGGLDNSASTGLEVRERLHGEHDGQRPGEGYELNAWSNFELIPCRDGKARRIESGTFPLAYGIPGRVGLLRGYGNAIVPPLVAEFIQAYREARFGQVAGELVE